ncbi:MAG: hypothetical protein WDW38_007101 [Sanguina aurantia]
MSGESAPIIESENVPVVSDVVNAASAPESVIIASAADPAINAAVEAARAHAASIAEKFAAEANGDNKRKFDGEEGPDSKKNHSDHSQAAMEGGGEITEIVNCPGDKVGRIIGRMGATIKDLQSRTGTRIQVDQKVPGDQKPITITGSRADVEHAKRAISEVLTSDAPSSVPGDTSRSIECPQGIVGRIIGRGGETIRSLQQASNAHILVDQNFPEGAPRKVTISGRPESVERAYKMITELIDGEPSGAQNVIQKFGLGLTKVIECPKPMVGRVIGKGGETIKGLQKQFSASIQIDQMQTPCKITITGPTQAVNDAERAVYDIIEDRNGPPPGAGGYGGGGGGPYGGGGGGGHQATPYGAPYGAPPYQPPSYAAPYGAPAPYGAYGAPAYAAPAYQQPPPAYAQYGGAYGAPQDPYAGGYGGAGGYGAPPAPAPAPSPWQAQLDEQGRTYYYNSQTGVSQWEKPAEMP